MSKKKDLLITIIFIVIGIVLFLIVGMRFYNDFLNKPEEDKKISSIDLYGYTLSKSDTDLYKNTFKELENVLNSEEIDYKSYASLISKLFIIDVFTLDNKLASTDIGGIEFLYDDLEDNFKENMGATLYRGVKSNINGDREQELPIVSSIEVSDVFETKYDYNDVSYDSYLVSLNWDYEKDLGYQNSIKLTLIKVEDILYIVKGE